MWTPQISSCLTCFSHECRVTSLDRAFSLCLVPCSTSLLYAQLSHSSVVVCTYMYVCTYVFVCVVVGSEHAGLFSVCFKSFQAPAAFEMPAWIHTTHIFTYV